MAAYSILIVDDDVRFGRCAQRAMSGMGHIVEQISRSCEIFDRYDGFAPDCEAEDDLTHELGDPEEASLAEAVFYLETGMCSP